MSWKEHHRESALLASRAEDELRSNNPRAAQVLYARAAATEEQAVAVSDTNKKRTPGISVVSTAALYYKSRDFPKAQAVAYRWLGEGNLPVEKRSLSGRVFRPRQIENRIAVQRGVLVHIESGTIPDTAVTRNVIIEECDKRAILQILEREYGIHHAALFPDLEMFRRDMEEGRVRFPNTMLAAGASAMDRDDYQTAKSHFRNCVASYLQRHPEDDGGFVNIVPMRNLAITLAMLGEWDEAIRVGDLVLQLAKRHRSTNNSRVFKETEKVVADIGRRAIVAGLRS